MLPPSPGPRPIRSKRLCLELHGHQRRFAQPDTGADDDVRVPDRFTRAERSIPSFPAYASP
jgi:hypothetical protein